MCSLPVQICISNVLPLAFDDFSTFHVRFVCVCVFVSFGAASLQRCIAKRRKKTRAHMWKNNLKSRQKKCDAENKNKGGKRITQFFHHFRVLSIFVPLLLRVCEFIETYYKNQKQKLCTELCAFETMTNILPSS